MDKSTKKAALSDRIWELYAKGWFVWQIAKELEITEAEVVAALGR